jgi:hypothetical protein
MEVLDYPGALWKQALIPCMVAPGTLPARAIAHFVRCHHEAPNPLRYDLKHPRKSWQPSKRTSAAVAAKKAQRRRIAYGAHSGTGVLFSRGAMHLSSRPL